MTCCQTSAVWVVTLASIVAVTSCSSRDSLPPVAKQSGFEQLSTPPSLLPPPPPPGPGVDSNGPLHSPWPRRKLRILETRATAGDRNAAWELAMYYALRMHDEEREDEWRHRAAGLRHPEAERYVASLIREGITSFALHGDTPQEAVRALLGDACVEQEHSSSCYDLAEALEGGYLGHIDAAAARAHYERGPELGDRMCWTVLARRLRDGIGGPVDRGRAYYWISLEARCVDPRSVSGKEAWQLREELAETLGMLRAPRTSPEAPEHALKLKH